jgi:hypothetical protein
MIDLYAPSGIGDIYWILQKLARTANAAGEKFRIHTPPGKDDKAARGKFLEYIDCVESVTPDGVPFKELAQKAQQYTTLAPVMFCECNTWLESGKRIEQYLPAFPTEYILNWQISDEAKRRAEKVIKADKKNIFVYMSGVANNNSASTGKWDVGQWRVKLEKIRTPDVNLVWLGATYDADALAGVSHLFDRVTLNLSADVVVAALRMADGFISFQSGLSVVSVIEGVPTYMLYFKHTAGIMQGFNPPGNFNYRPVFFDALPDFAPWVAALPLRGRSGLTWLT